MRKSDLKKSFEMTSKRVDELHDRELKLIKYKWKLYKIPQWIHKIFGADAEF